MLARADPGDPGEKCPLNGSYQGLAAWENQTGSPVGWDVGKSTLCIFHTGISLQTWLYQISDKCVITFELITLSTQKMAFCLSLKLVVSPAFETWIFEVAKNVFHKFSNCAGQGKQGGGGQCRMTSLPSRLYLFNSSPLVHVRFPGEEGGRARGQFVS